MVHTYIGLTDTSLEAKSYAYEYEISLEVKKLFQLCLQYYSDISIFIKHIRTRLTPQAHGASNKSRQRQIILVAVLPF